MGLNIDITIWQIIFFFFKIFLKEMFTSRNRRKYYPFTFLKYSFSLTSTKLLIAVFVRVHQKNRKTLNYFAQ